MLKNIIYVFIDDLLIKLKNIMHKNIKISDAKVIAKVFESAIYFSSHHEKTMIYKYSTGLIPHISNKIRLNRRLY